MTTTRKKKAPAKPVKKAAKKAVLSKKSTSSPKNAAKATKTPPKSSKTTVKAAKKGAVAKTKAKKAPSLPKFQRPSMVSQFGSKEERFDPRLQAMMDKGEIGEVLARFARGIDRLDENLLRSVLHHDATLDFGPGVFQGTSGDFVHWILGVFQNVRSSHHMIANTFIELDGDFASVESYFHTHIRIEKPIGREDVFWGGRYLDRLERRPSGSAGVWKIMHRKQILDWARTESAADFFYHQNPDALWSARTKTDPSYQMDQFPGAPHASGRGPSFLGRHYESKSIKF